jgi:hypothetical protein
MGDPDTFWLNLTNLVLGGAAAALFALFLCGIVAERFRRNRRSLS